MEPPSHCAHQKVWKLPQSRNKGVRDGIHLKNADDANVDNSMLHSNREQTRHKGGVCFHADVPGAHEIEGFQPFRAVAPPCLAPSVR